MIKQLRQAYPSRDGAPIIAHVDLNIFVKRYFTYCLDCTFCHDACCLNGADIDSENVQRINAHAEALEAHTNVRRSEWFSGEFHEDAEFAGGSHTPPKVNTGASP